MDLVDHLHTRHLNLELHRPMLDVQEGIVTFWLYDLSGRIVGYQQYRPLADKIKNNDPKLSRYFTFKSKDKLAVWGLESIHLSSNILFVTEGIFDACRLTNRGYSSIAILSNDSTKQIKEWLSCLGRKIICICDNDTAGRRLAKLGDSYYIMKSHDLGDCSEEELEYILETNWINR